MVLTEAEPDDPTFIMLVSNDPSVAVWGAMFLLFQVTLELSDMVLGIGT
jgi:hypothetical protein